MAHKKSRLCGGARCAAGVILRRLLTCLFYCDKINVNSSRILQTVGETDGEKGLVMIAIIDYGAGNIQSVYKALRYIGAEATVTRDSSVILESDGAILPGVGSFGDCMDSLNSFGIQRTVKEFTASGKPFLGICLGLQLLFGQSEESPGVEGLNLLQGKIKKIPNTNGLKVPHIGWNSLDITNNTGIFRGIAQNSFVYFVHSYYLDADDKNIVTARVRYGVTVDAAVNYKNITAVQFHPEKSGDTGLKMLRNFVDMTLSGGDGNVC